MKRFTKLKVPIDRVFRGVAKRKLKTVDFLKQKIDCPSETKLTIIVKAEHIHLSNGDFKGNVTIENGNLNIDTYTE